MECKNCRRELNDAYARKYIAGRYLYCKRDDCVKYKPEIVKSVPNVSKRVIEPKPLYQKDSDEQYEDYLSDKECSLI